VILVTGVRFDTVGALRADVSTLGGMPGALLSSRDAAISLVGLDVGGMIMLSVASKIRRCNLESVAPDLGASTTASSSLSLA
jgi:hypothetical protein